MNTAQLSRAVEDVYLRALESELTEHAPALLCVALQQLDTRATSGKGGIVGGEPAAGVSVRRGGGSYHFRVTDVNATDYSWVESSSMKYARLPDFAQSLRDILGG